MDLEAELDAVRSLDIDELAASIQAIGFECTRCGACCKGHGDEHTATVSPDEVRRLMGPDQEWRDVARPIPFGLEDGTGETFEWALQTGSCGDCRFYEEGESTGTCTVYEDRPRICRTYPFSIEVAGSDPMGAVVGRDGAVRAHECDGLGRDISRTDAEAMARQLKERAIHDLQELRAVKDAYEPFDRDPGEAIVHDSEGAKRADGTPVERR